MVMQKIESAAVTLLMAVLIAIGIRFYFVTLPKMDAEVEEARNLSLIAVQNGANLRVITEREKTDLPATQAKMNTVLDDTHALLVTANKKIAELDTKGVSGSAVDALNALKDGIAATAGSVKDIGEQTVASEKAIAKTADAATQTAQAATKTADATTDTAQASATLVKGVTDPAIKTAKNVQAASGDVKDAANEGREWLHKALHPKWPKVVYGEVKDFAAKTLGAWL